MPIKLINGLAAMASGYFGAAAALAMPAALLTIEPAYAESTNFNESCLRSASSLTCSAQWYGGRNNFPRIIRIAPPNTDEEIAEAAEREQKWVAFCKPVIKQDRYGVGRYYYAAPGCEFGRRK